MNHIPQSLLTFKTSTSEKPNDDDENKNSTSNHQLHLKVLKPHLASKLPALPLEAVSLSTFTDANQHNHKSYFQVQTLGKIAHTWN